MKFSKNTGSKNPKVLKTKHGSIMQNLEESKCDACDCKKLKFIKEQEATGVLCPLEIKTPLSKIPLVGPLLF